MAVLKHSAIGMLIIMLLSAGFPNPSSHDANGDGRIDLADAIRHMAEFQKSSESPEIFSDRIAGMISALRTLVGYDIQIKPADDAAASSAPLMVEQTYLVSVSSELNSPMSYSLMPSHKASYHSIIIAPQVPPPRSA